MMKRKFVGVRMPDDILVRVKKMAGDQGRSVSETVVMLVVKSLESGPTKKEVDSAIEPEVVRFLAEKVARINALLNGVSSKADMAGHVDRCRQAEAAAFAETKKLFGG